MNRHEKKQIVKIAFGPVDAEVLEVMVEDGAEKHGLLGWLERRSRVHEVEHALEHIDNWLAGDDEDPDSSNSPLAHAIARLKTARSMEIEGAGEDDRDPQAHAAMSGAEDPGHPDDVAPRVRDSLLPRLAESLPDGVRIRASGRARFVLTPDDDGGEL